MKISPLVALALLATPAAANPVVITNDPGGYVFEYVAKVRETTFVRFDGWCASACTLYLSVPRSCVTHRAQFAFHRARGAGAKGNRVVSHMMWQSYPRWVRQWIAANGGFTNRLIVMPNSVIRQHMRVCA